METDWVLKWEQIGDYIVLSLGYCYDRPGYAFVWKTVHFETFEISGLL